MTFNHYAKIKRILIDYGDDWTIKLINESTFAKKFNGETIQYEHYYRIYNKYNNPIKFCKFQQIELLAKILNKSVEELPVITPPDFAPIEP